jgi:hypothetical protein
LQGSIKDLSLKKCILFENTRLNRKSDLRPKDLLKDEKVTSSKYSVEDRRGVRKSVNFYCCHLLFFFGTFVVIYLLRAFKCHFNKDSNKYSN